MAKINKQLKFKKKGWIWKLTWPFAHNNFTTIGYTIYTPKAHRPGNATIAHESQHIEQQEENGVFWFILVYLFALPFLWNPWRWKWEYKAFKAGGVEHDQIVNILRSRKYGWLKFNGKEYS